MNDLRVLLSEHRRKDGTLAKVMGRSEVGGFVSNHQVFLKYFVQYYCEFMKKTKISPFAIDTVLLNNL